MHVCMYVCMYVRIYIHMLIYIYGHIYMHTCWDAPLPRMPVVSERLIPKTKHESLLMATVYWVGKHPNMYIYISGYTGGVGNNWGNNWYLLKDTQILPFQTTKQNLRQVMKPGCIEIYLIWICKLNSFTNKFAKPYIHSQRSYSSQGSLSQGSSWFRSHFLWWPLW